ncbi:ATP-binding protein [Arachnia propionica]|jgi:predicted transcriptional regulator with HTH domain|uniref:DNA binding domain-containing protein n=2 Tax=Arachnia propionica TaxID=1750 RepID=A0AB37HVT7_9ACTN|nr:ATP-binding protein [Arachnia propionica]AFN46786.1 divergent AAA domain protein [Arachnia propionica F0230a]QUC11410.1 putative DNA binding domain-containing protein [Arachnia propionica]
MTSAVVDRSLTLTPEQVGPALLALAEDQWFERKSARVSPRDLAVPLVAMANADGGVIVVGLHDGKVEDVPAQRRNELRQACLDYTEPPVRARVEEVEALDAEGESATLVLLNIAPGETVHVTQKGECYLRVGDESRRLTAAQQRELVFDRGMAHYEATPVNLTLADLDQQALADYAERIGAATIEGALAARDLVDRRGRLTVASELLFDERPQREFPNAVVRILKYGAEHRGVGRNMTLEQDRRVEGSLLRQISEAIRQIEDMMPAWQQLSDAGTFEPISRIPRDAWLEGLVNAVVHRSYSTMGDHIRFEIFPSRIEITSPGRFPGIVEPQRPLDIRRYARNPRIARVCADLGYTRELGEGIARLFAEMRGRGLVDPHYFQSSSSVTLTLSAQEALPEEIRSRLTRSAIAILNTLRQTGEPLSTGALAELAGVARMTATRALAQLEELGLVIREGSAKQDPRATWHLT